MSWSKEQIEKAKEWDRIIKRVISNKKEWRVPVPTVTEHFNRIYGEQKTTIWLTWENQSFEIGVYSFARAIEFSVQENDPEKKQFWTETYTPFGEVYSSHISKSIVRNIEYIYMNLTRFDEVKKHFLEKAEYYGKIHSNVPKYYNGKQSGFLDAHDFIYSLEKERK